MQPDVAEIKRQAEAGDISQTEIAFHAPASLNRSKICRIFRGYEKATDDELQALEEALRAAARAKALRLTKAVPGILDELKA